MSAQSDGTVSERSGISEVFINEDLNEAYIRGFAFSSASLESVTVTLPNGSVLAPLNDRMERKDIAQKFPNCMDARCGFDFLIRDVPDADSHSVDLAILTRDGTNLGKTLDLGRACRRIRARTKLERVSVDLVNHTVQVSGRLLGSEDLTLRSMALNGHVLEGFAATRDRPHGEGDKRYVKFTATAALSTFHQRESYQIGARAGQVLTVSASRAKSSYVLTASHTLTDEDLKPAVGSILTARRSTANNNVEIRGLFVGRFNSANVRLSIDGVQAHHSARVEADGQAVRLGLAPVFDAPFEEWVWCDQIAQPLAPGLKIRAELADAGRLLSSVEIKLHKDQISETAEPLEPSRFISPYQDYFDRLIERSAKAVDPTIVFVFPGDLFATFGGGPTRVQRMATYMRGMGYKVVLIDQVQAEPDFSAPPKPNGIFDVHLPLATSAHDELCRLALDYMSREPVHKDVRGALMAALGDQPDVPEDLVLKRMRPLFNAMSSFLTSLVSPDFLVVNFVWTAPIFDAIPGSICKILDAHDVQHLRARQQAEMTGEPGVPAALEHEIALWQKADYVLAIQQGEKDFIIEASGRNNVILCGHANDVAATPPTGGPNPVVLFVGNRYGPNIHGITSFIETGWGDVHKALPKAELWVVGAVCEALGEVPAGIRKLGIVDDLEAVYAKATLVINPVDFGTGLNIKTVEALCLGCCLVCTPHGIRGLDLPGDAVCVRAADNFALAIVDLLKHPDKRKEYQENALAYAREMLTPDHIFREMFNVMELRMYS